MIFESLDSLWFSSNVLSQPSPLPPQFTALNRIQPPPMIDQPLNSELALDLQTHWLSAHNKQSQNQSSRSAIKSKIQYREGRRAMVNRAGKDPTSFTGRRRSVLLEREKYCQGSRQGSSRDRRGSRRQKTEEVAAANQAYSSRSRISVDRPVDRPQ